MFTSSVTGQSWRLQYGLGLTDKPTAHSNSNSNNKKKRYLSPGGNLGHIAAALQRTGPYPNKKQTKTITKIQHCYLAGNTHKQMCLQIHTFK